MDELPRLRPGGRIYPAVGAPYREALRDYFNDEGRAEVWELDYGYRTGDLILTLVKTAPRMLIALEVAANPAREGRMIDIAEAVAFGNGILAETVTRRAGVTGFESQPFYAGDEARRLWKALDEEYRRNRPWFTPDRWNELTDDAD